MKRTFTHIPPPNNIQELKTTQTEEGRFYLAPGEKRYPSVTTVCGFEKARFFAKWRAENPVEAKRTTDRGNVLHEACEKYLNNEDVGELASNEAMLFANLKRSLHRIDNIRAQEVPLWSHTLRLAGRVDCVAEFDGKLSIIDFKGSTRRKSPSNITNYFCQATAYSIMWHEMMGEEIEQIVILVTSEDGSSQVFVKQPIDFVPDLKHAIDHYEKSNVKVSGSTGVDLFSE